MTTKLEIGIDLGGTKIEVIAFDETAQVVARHRTATPQGDYWSTLATISEMVTLVETELGRTGTVGVGIPGAESPGSGLIKNANSTCLIGHPLRQDLETLLQRQVRIANDANCFALSEAVDGAGRDAEVVFGVILGTGVGGGLVVHRQVISGVNRIAGEWGHNPLPYPEEELSTPARCYCGRVGCIESWLSGPALAEDHRRCTGSSLSSVEIAANALNGNESCEATLLRFERRLAKSLATIINILDPEVIVLGGGLSNLDRLYTSIPELWKEYVFSDTISTRLCRNRHGDSSGVRGAAWLWRGM